MWPLSSRGGGQGLSGRATKKNTVLFAASLSQSCVKLNIRGILDRYYARRAKFLLFDLFKEYH